ncbi:hypothetical protein AAV99_03875 [Aurantiacibacter marinus]|uniref:PAS domain-containing protein n=1 Tax=Aurantiacibacter marinus TaxID=874156 RepID=A0A0H0XT90_9SPHN|nr:hypothetical protein AAV99_03875 [Aurantiacibacter marinus]
MHDLEDEVDDSPPPSIGGDERRMQVRAYNFWASLLEDRNFPSIEDLDPTLLPDFGPNSVLLDFSIGGVDPTIAFIGEKLAAECKTTDDTPERLSDVTPRSLLSRITDHYMQIIANQSPIGFEAEFVNHAGATILYRGILLPFSSDDETIDFIYGVINWKEMADARSASELLLEIDQALEDSLTLGKGHARKADLTDWADGPAAFLGRDTAPDEEAVRPSFDLSGQSDLPVQSGAASGPPSVPVAFGDPESMELADWLAAARETAQLASSSEERTRAALYDAVGRAWDFAIAAAGAPKDFAELLKDAGIAMQERAPMTPVVKLVFGTGYDKTRLTEYAAVLSYAQRNGIERGKLGAYLTQADGGLKGVVAEERAFRRAGAATRPVRKGPRKVTVRKLRNITPQGFAALPPEGEEFALVMVRRTESGELVVLGEVPQNAGLLEKAARSLMS